ncbi:STAS domain-containing protein [Catellatospora bangladeshensis]|uniref:Anti-sigma factor antagonist n=1 Tax=Catellatospora bangladeshensis TaxID=310355 RepID=A0A8J3NLU6_9ACTN|nr:STAS domain-containing protein [Catellatospora bangladeshensis]GIF82940.1 hypothetical protein Cba03nite_42890 [Catellatospora bangladeshensis]
MLTVDVRREPDRTVLVLSGELDLATGPVLTGALARVAAEPRVDLDVTGLSYCDSCGLNIMLAARHRARRESRELRVVGPRGFVARVIGACDASRVLLGG